jgi:hypothetical protein
MSIFFNIATDSALLHAQVRDNPELQNVVDQVEFEIIEAFKQRDMQRLTTYESFFNYEFGRDPLQEVKVRLVGYDEETPEDSDADLKELLKRTIAKVVSWVLRNYDNADKAQSIRQGQRSITYSGVVPSWKDWYSGWDNMLHNYDARIKGYGI